MTEQNTTSSHPTTDRETYLGDGLYASFDGWQIRLRAPGEVGDNIVYLEPAVIQSFESYVRKLREGKL